MTWRLFVKRSIDIVTSTIALILLSPLFLIISFLIVKDSKGGAFYRQVRVGRNGRKFKIFKFRSMIKNAENMGKGFYFDGESDSRITNIGRILRVTSIDELPQIINILKGDMSIIGPRPMIVPIYIKLDENQKRRSKMLPGITGLAQINGRNSISWSKRIEYDLKYCEDFSLLLDLKIFFLTIKRTIFREDIRIDQAEEDVDDLDK